MPTWTHRLGLTLLLPSTLLAIACGNDVQTTTEGDGSTTDASTTNASQTTNTPTTNTPTTGASATEGMTDSATSGSTGDVTTGATTGDVTATTGDTTGGTNNTTGQDPTCDDSQLNGLETDVDCGGPDCSPCADGLMCLSESDCQTMSCFDGQCGPPPPGCDDGEQNGDETDVDCGGSCSPCADGLMCLVAEDCQSSNCDGIACVAAACDDNILNGAESDVDCGGPDCKSCGEGFACNSDADCDTGSCEGGFCVPPTCDDKKMNGQESDVDCGGPDCVACQNGQMCQVNDDCDGGSCMNNKCVGPSCMDMIQNGQETGVDCGGPDCKACSVPGLIINEVDYDNVGTDNAEFIEILNTTNLPILLAGHQLVLVNGSNNTVYATINLAGAGTINPGQYLVVAPPNFMVPNGVLKVNFAGTQDQVQNGAPDGLLLVDTLMMKKLDSLAYEGTMPPLNVPGVGMVDLVEGTVLPMNVADDNANNGSLSRLPNGYDGNNAATDWAFSKMPTPGAANVP